jgi:hypothetical protein
LAGLIADEKLGWSRTFLGNFEVCDVPGHQQNVMLEPNVSQLAKEFSIRLKAAQQRPVRGTKARTARERAQSLALSK